MPKDITKYENERLNIYNSILDILNINDINTMFSLHQIDSNIDIQNKIFSLEDDIKKYFKYSNWTCYKRKDHTKRRWLSIIRYVVKDTGHELYPIKIKETPSQYDTKYYLK